MLTDEVKEIAADLDDAVLDRARGRGARRQAAARRPLRRRLARPRRRVDRGGGRHEPRALLRPRHAAPPSAGIRWRRSERWPPPPSGRAVTARPKTKRRSRALQRRGADRAGCSCCPASIGFVVFYAYPALRGFYLSFTDFDLLKNSGSWVGLDNYRALLQDTLFWNALWITFKYVIINIGIQTVLALGDRGADAPPDPVGGRPQHRAAAVAGAERRAGAAVDVDARPEPRHRQPLARTRSASPARASSAPRAR